METQGAELMKIIIDAGHGPETAGKRSPDGTLREFMFNSATAGYVTSILQQYADVEVRNTYDMNSDMPLITRTNAANAWPADLFVSIHANAVGEVWSSYGGIETYTYTTKPAAAVRLATAVQKKLIELTGLADRGVKAANFHVLRETKMTSILVECGFMDNREECELLKTDAYRKTCAVAIVAGIAETYGLKLKVPPVPNAAEKSVIQKNCQFENPEGVWNLMDRHAYADSVYKKWAASYQ
jgi:N-acetylmuramoyl-L-alanine amidase